MIEKIRKHWETNPLLLIMLTAAIFRLLAAIFSKGYAMSDDHFVIIHIAQRWLDGYNDWFDKDHPSGFSLVYPGLHYILFYLLKLIGIMDPQIKMTIVRLLHAAYSLLIVYYGYQITLRLSDQKTARQAGIFLALFWLLPFMSVRNLVEMVCIPPMMTGFYLGLSADDKKRPVYWLISGLLFGFAFAIRYQTILITGGIVLVLLGQQKWRPFLLYSAGVLTGMFMLQGLVDWIAWGFPFAAFLQYAGYNIDYRYEYITGPWYRYLLTILGVLIPPVSIYLFFGFLKSWKKYALLFWPVLVFLVFHSYFPNKQERFILPVLPFLVILGFAGWQIFLEKSDFLKRHPKILKGSWIWYWIINTILLLVLTFTYSKRSMVEPLTYLSAKPDLKALIIEYPADNMPWFPRFYLEPKVPVYRFSKDITVETFRTKVREAAGDFPNYIYFYGIEQLKDRVRQMEMIFGINLIFEKEISPSNIDWILHVLNPRHNKNHSGFIYRVSKTDE
jgi:4-amino-4-deoxy-L-arabinose transferase-like glycosyltransferase